MDFPALIPVWDPRVSSDGLTSESHAQQQLQLNRRNLPWSDRLGWWHDPCSKTTNQYKFFSDVTGFVYSWRLFFTQLINWEAKLYESYANYIIIFTRLHLWRYFLPPLGLGFEPRSTQNSRPISVVSCHPPIWTRFRLPAFAQFFFEELGDII